MLYFNGCFCSPEGATELFCVCMGDAVMHYFTVEKLELSSSWKGTIDEKVCCFKMRGVKSKLFNGVSSRSP